MYEAFAMSLPKVYHRFSLLSLHSTTSPFLPKTLFLSSSLPLAIKRLHSPPLLRAQSRRFVAGKQFKAKSTMASSRFHHLVPVNALTAEDVGNGTGSKGADDATASVAYDDDVESASVTGYRLPPFEIRDIVDAPPLPALSFSPLRDKILFLKRRSLPPLSDLARPEEKLAGIRIDGKCNTRSRMSFYTGIAIHQLMEDGSLGPEKEIQGLPEGAKINFVTWSNNGQHLAFSVRLDEDDGSSSKLRVWVANVDTGKARPLFESPDVYVNAVFDNFVWVNDSTLLVCTIPLSRGDPPRKPLVPSGPKIQSNEQRNVIQARTYQDLLKDEHDEDLFEYYATTQLVLASLDGEMKPFGPPAIYTSMDPSPDQTYILTSSTHKPFSFVVPCGRFPKKVELWKANGEFVRELCDLPLAEDIPIAFNSVRKGMRSINWRADKPSTLYWVETQDGGDAKVDVSPRDIVYTQSPAPHDNEQPKILHKLDLRYGGISWCDDTLALVYESWYKTRKVRTWVISPGSEDLNPRILFDRSSEDVYSDPGSPMSRRTPAGTYVIAKVKKEDDGDTYILLNGSGATPEGNIPFLDLFDINTGSKERIWQSDKENYFETVVALMSDQKEGELSINELKILTSKESKTENTQYYLLSWPEKRACYDSSRDGPLPCLVWSYPGEFKSKEAASQVRGSPNEFAGIGPTSPLLWLARRFAVLSGPTIPIIGEGDEEANDRYIEQLVASAEAAVEEVIRRGVADPNKIAVGGHSYGAFMTANLLAHAPHLFCCGIARSGAYNRTLTPFGFQNEERTLWEATSTYVEMSPFMSANKIKKPILLIHGEEDNNPGTLTMQSDRFFNALKGHGALCRLVILPYESHGYGARESIMHTLWETDRWLQKHCVYSSDVSACKDNAEGTVDSQSKAVGAAGDPLNSATVPPFAESRELLASSLSVDQLCPITTGAPANFTPSIIAPEDSSTFTSFS
ncbi:hypothetical protein RDI58_001680 [Solanum bulbocastanum]|uniref:Probable glutamyl endopeptidase, chloroplastic n=1 Tax=Solanum bulbocastanum TaxID=147425 RepID=A0AAN8YQF4_SOLBU